MKAAVIYYSLEGSTDKIAKGIAEGGAADLCRLVPKKEYPTGKVSKFIWGGKAATMGEKPELVNPPVDLGQYDTLVIGTPIWAGTYAPPLNTFLHENEIKGKNIVLVATCAGGSAEKCFEKMKEYLKECTILGTIRFVNPAKASEAELAQQIAEIRKLITEN